MYLFRFMAECYFLILSKINLFTLSRSFLFKPNKYDATHTAIMLRNIKDRFEAIPSPYNGTEQIPKRKRHKRFEELFTETIS